MGGILLLAFLLRAALLLVAAQHLDRAFSPDTQTYIDPALKLLASGFYPADSAWRTPGYPFFIAFIYWLGGENPFLVILAQVFVSALTVYLTYQFGKKLFPHSVALIGAFLLAISVESITYTFELLTETLFTFFLIAVMLAWVNAYQQNSLLWCSISAILMGICVMVRPEAVFFPVLLALAWLFKKGIKRVRQLGFAGVFLGIYLLTLVPWLVRNNAVLGFPSISTITNYNLLFYNAASLEANLRNLSEAEIRLEYLGRVAKALDEHGWVDTEANRDRVEGILARQIIFSHPLRYLYIHLKDDLNGLIPDVTGPTEILGVTVGGKGTLSVLNHSGILAAIRNYFGPDLWALWLTIPVVLLLGLIYLLDLAGVVGVIQQRLWLAGFATLGPTAYYLLLPGAASLPRFRVPAMPYLCLLAAMGVYLVWSITKRGSVKRTSPGLEQ